MKFPKSPMNTQTLQGLGLVGSGSLTPYQKTYVNLLDNGFPVVLNGLLNVRETGNDYGIYIQEGFVDFLRANPASPAASVGNASTGIHGGTGRWAPPTPS
jgi:hypothetical protein